MASAFIREYPEVRIRLINGDTEMIIDDVLEGRVEFGLVGAKTRQRSIFQEPLFEDELAMIVASGHPWAGRTSVTLDELSREPYITRKSGSGTLLTIRDLLARQAYHLHDFNIISEMGSTAAVVNAVLAGGAVSIVSRVAVSENVKTGSLKALSIAGLSLSRTFYRTRHMNRSLSPLGKRFISFLKNARPPAPAQVDDKPHRGWGKYLCGN
ncbi:MAG: LysR substrate-binding domain-containing protein [bacterium]|nr:LysR substrate-binding domain-containing protein [bacterium]